MTDQELRQIVARLAEAQAETDRQLKATDRQLKEVAERQLQESERRRQESERQLQESERQRRESERRRRESKRRDEELERARQAREEESRLAVRREVEETARVVREVGKQLGGLGDKFGSFTEAMALPSMTKLLEERFGMSVISPRVRVRRNGRVLELDVLAYSNRDRDEVYVVEVKSHLHEDGLQQLLRTLEVFPTFFPEHRGKKLYGILAAVDIPDELRPGVLQHGLFLARIHDDLFELQVPEGFEARSFG